MNRKLKFREKLAFGMGDFGGNFCFSFLTSFALIYFTDIAGANAAAVATLLAVAKCFDGVTDLIMGSIIDHTHSRMGKARPWLFGSAFPLTIALVMMFNVPQSLSGTGKLVYIFIVYVLLCAFFYTASNISYNALTSLVTDDPDDRVAMGSVRFMCTAVAGIIIGSFTTVIIEAFGSGQKGWTAVSIIYASIFFVSTMITVFGLKEMKSTAVDKETEKKKEKVKSDVSFGKSVIMLLKNRYFILILLIFIVLYVFTGGQGSAGIYYATYVLGNANLYGMLSIAMMVPMFISLIFASKLTEKLGLQKACILCAALFVAGSLVMTAGDGSVPVLVIGIVIRSLGMGPISTAIFALIAEVADNIRFKKRAAIEGMVYSCSSIGIKIGSGLGVAVVGWLLELGHYDSTLAVQTEGSLNMISASYLVMPLVVGIIILVLFLFMSVEKENKELRKEYDQSISSR